MVLITISSSLILFVILLFILSLFFKRKSIPKNCKELPGDSGWPIVGNLFSFHEPLWSYLYKKSKIYGPIFKFTMGFREIVILSSNEILNKSLKEKGVLFSGRWQNILFKITAHNSGILLTDKEWWAVQRSFILKVLKDFGLGKQRSVEIVNHEVSILIKDIEDICGEITSARALFPKSMVNIISKLVMNMRFERDSKNFKSITELIERATQNRRFLFTLIMMYPFLENFPNLIKFIIWCTGGQRRANLQYGFIKEIIDEHKKRFNEENEGEDLMDMFLKEQHKLEKENVKNHSFTEWQLIRVGIELFIAGYETTSTTLVWSTLLMARHPKIQEKVHNEIINLIGTERIPNLGDKKFLPYTQAVMDEIFRFSSVVPLALPHRTFEETSIDGYFIPQNSIVFPNLYACHRDKSIWEKPFDFYPEHFLIQTNKNDFKYVPHDELVPFSIGKRQCLGEALARMEFFVFFTSIFQRFKVKFEDNMTDERYSEIIKGTNGTIRAPLNSDVIFEMR